jgi:hypothetical protein
MSRHAVAQKNIANEQLTAILRLRREIEPRILADAHDTPDESSMTIGLQEGLYAQPARTSPS